jgi:hypothetical protein
MANKELENDSVKRVQMKSHISPWVNTFYRRTGLRHIDLFSKYLLR